MTKKQRNRIYRKMLEIRHRIRRYWFIKKVKSYGGVSTSSGGPYKYFNAMFVNSYADYLHGKEFELFKELADEGIFVIVSKQSCTANRDYTAFFERPVYNRLEAIKETE